MTQLEYLEILLNDTGFGTRAQRNAYLSRIFDREVNELGELRLSERSRLVQLLKTRIADSKPERRDDRDPEEDEE